MIITRFIMLWVGVLKRRRPRAPEPERLDEQSNGSRIRGKTRFSFGLDRLPQVWPQIQRQRLAQHGGRDQLVEVQDFCARTKSQASVLRLATCAAIPPDVALSIAANSHALTLGHRLPSQTRTDGSHTPEGAGPS